MTLPISLRSYLRSSLAIALLACIVDPNLALGDDKKGAGSILSDVAKPREVELLPRMNGIASRSGNTLSLELAAGESRHYKDSSPDCYDFSECWSYVLFQHETRQDVVVLWVQLWATMR